jgi:DNA end-binding protein Ku
MADSVEIRSQAIWSGVITFGLVSVPVGLLPAQRSSRISLRMLAPDGTPLRRRYYCSKDDRPVSAEEIVRGYEIEKDHYVIVTDDELEALAPQKSKEIDLRRFVPLAQIDPAFFDRAYFLMPLGDTIKPYRLLAAAMEASGRAGIATFVMHGKEYLVAILSENGILRAETLRFADEIRSPADIGLGEPVGPTQDALKTMTAEIRAAVKSELDTQTLNDPKARQLSRLIEEKRQKGAGVISAASPAGEPQEGKVIDLMEILKRSVGLKNAEEEDGAAGDAASVQQIRQTLYEQAKVMGISGRSSMSKEELAKAIQDKKRT